MRNLFRKEKLYIMIYMFMIYQDNNNGNLIY